MQCDVLESLFVCVVDGKVDEITIPQEERSFSNHYSSES